jgi:hypothetical protein
MHPEETATMGNTARREYERRSRADINYSALMEIYQRVLGHRVALPLAEGPRIPELVSS